MNPESQPPASSSSPSPHKRRPRYPGKNPRKFEHKYKEHSPDQYPETIAKVVASGKTPAGTHLPILVQEILEILNPQPDEKGVDCTLGYGGHASRLLEKIQPHGTLLALDVDPVEQPKTEARLRAAGFDFNQLIIKKSNFAGLKRILSEIGWSGADFILADLGVSSMQLDRPERGFSLKYEGPLDMRMNPLRGVSAAQWLKKATPEKLSHILQENADEPQADFLAQKLASKEFLTTTSLAHEIRSLLHSRKEEEIELSVRRVFQALRIEVNEEFSALDQWLKQLPDCLNPEGRVAVLTFHSGEDRRVKKAFQQHVREGRFQAISDIVIRATPEECRNNSRASSAKLRWAIK